MEPRERVSKSELSVAKRLHPVKKNLLEEIGSGIREFLAIFVWPMLCGTPRWPSTPYP